MAFDSPLFRGGLAKTFRKIRLTDADNQIEFGSGGILSWTPTAARTITLPDAGGELVTTGNLTDVPLATTTTAGTVIVPTAGRLAVDGSGNISVPLATGAVFGVVEVTTGNGLALASGVVSVALSTSTTAGTVIVPTTGHLSVDGSGNITVNTTDVPLLAAATNAFTGIVSMTAARPARVLPTMSATTISLNPALGNTFVLVGVNATQSAQTVNLSVAPPAGQFLYVLAQSTAAGTVTYTWGANFKVSAATSVVTTLGYMALVFVSDGTNAYEVSRSAVLAL